MIEIYTKKVVRLKNKKMEILKEIEKEIKSNGGEINTTQLIRDAVDIFLIYFKNEAVRKYSMGYKIKKENIGEI